MARPNSTAGGRPHIVSIRLSDREKAALDQQRGTSSPAAYIRSLIAPTAVIHDDPDRVPLAEPRPDPMPSTQPEVVTRQRTRRAPAQKVKAHKWHKYPDATKCLACGGRQGWVGDNCPG